MVPGDFLVLAPLEEFGVWRGEVRERGDGLVGSGGKFLFQGGEDEGLDVGVLVVDEGVDFGGGGYGSHCSGSEGR